MKKVLLLGLVVMLAATSLASVGNTTIAQEGDDEEEDEFFGACAALTLEEPYSEECDAEIAANPFPADEIMHAIEFDEARDGKAHPRSIYIPEEPYKYPIAWQKRAWYFADAPGVLPAADDWTDARRIGKYTMYYVFKTFKVGNEVWHLIGPNQWMNQEFVSVLQIPETPEEIDGIRWVAIDLRQQTAVVFDEENTPVFATLVSTGYWFPTPEGLFHIYARTLSTTLIGPPGADPPVYVLPATPWVLFYHEHRALHGAAFHNYLGIKRSHGSINLAPGDAEWLWNFFAETEDVWDPPDGENFFVDNIDEAPWVYVYTSEEFPVTPEW